MDVSDTLRLFLKLRIFEVVYFCWESFSLFLLIGIRGSFFLCWGITFKLHLPEFLSSFHLAVPTAEHPAFSYIYVLFFWISIKIFGLNWISGWISKEERECVNNFSWCLLRFLRTQLSLGALFNGFSQAYLNSNFLAGTNASGLEYCHFIQKYYGSRNIKAERKSLGIVNRAITHLIWC